MPGGSLSAFPPSQRLSALSYISNTERVVYAETPAYLEVNVVPLLVGTLSASLFVLQLGLAAASVVDFATAFPLPPALAQPLAWLWFPCVALAVVRAVRRNANRYLVLTSAKLIYNDATDEALVLPYADCTTAAVVEGSYVRACFESDILVTLRHTAAPRRLEAVRQPRIVVDKLSALIALARKGGAEGA
jgi:hypothetical protein